MRFDDGDGEMRAFYALMGVNDQVTERAIARRRKPEESHPRVGRPRKRDAQGKLLEDKQRAPR
jgi:hypothetical protein